MTKVVFTDNSWCFFCIVLFRGFKPMLLLSLSLHDTVTTLLLIGLTYNLIS